MSLSPVTMKTGLSVDFEDFFIFCFLKNNDLHFCHLVREKKQPGVESHSYAHASRTHDSLGNSVLCRILVAQRRYCIIATPNRKEAKMISGKACSCKMVCVEIHISAYQYDRTLKSNIIFLQHGLHIHVKYRNTSTSMHAHTQFFKMLHRSS